MSVIESVLLYGLGSVFNMATGVCYYYTGLQPKMPGRFVFSDSTTLFYRSSWWIENLRLFFSIEEVYILLFLTASERCWIRFTISRSETPAIYNRVEHVCFPLWFVNFPDSPLFSPSLSLNYKVYLCRRFHLNNKFLHFYEGCPFQLTRIKVVLDVFVTNVWLVYTPFLSFKR